MFRLYLRIVCSHGLSVHSHCAHRRWCNCLTLCSFPWPYDWNTTISIDLRRPTVSVGVMWSITSPPIWRVQHLRVFNGLSASAILPACISRIDYIQTWFLMASEFPFHRIISTAELPTYWLLHHSIVPSLTYYLILCWFSIDVTLTFGAKYSKIRPLFKKGYYFNERGDEVVQYVFLA